jgi:hypothetical protein
VRMRVCVRVRVWVCACVCGFVRAGACWQGGVSCITRRLAGRCPHPSDPAGTDAGTDATANDGKSYGTGGPLPRLGEEDGGGSQDDRGKDDGLKEGASERFCGALSCFLCAGCKPWSCRVLVVPCCSLLFLVVVSCPC